VRCEELLAQSVDVAGWVEAIERVLRSPPPHKSFAGVRQELAWPHVAEPLVRIVGDAVAPARAPSLALSPLQERLLRARTSVALGGVVARQAEKLRARLR
jgi:hypothetical protein